MGKRYSLDHFRMSWDWLFKVLINITPIHRNCFKFSSLFVIIYLYAYLKTKFSNTIFVLELWLIEIGLWHQQRVVNVTKLSQLNSMTTQFSFLMITNMKSFQLFFTFIKIWMCALFEQLQICRRLWTKFHVWTRFVLNFIINTLILDYINGARILYSEYYIINPIRNIHTSDSDDMVHMIWSIWYRLYHMIYNMGLNLLYKSIWIMPHNLCVEQKFI